ncbi:MAG: alkylmercury lyase family protein [Candidatus Hodarchaeota archaeon]
MEVVQVKPTPSDRTEKLYQQVCNVENMSAKYGKSLSHEENEVRRFILTQTPKLGRLPSLTEVEQAFTKFSEEEITAILTKLDQLDVIHLNNEQKTIIAAYPFSGKPTPHKVTFKSEDYNSINAMCAIDALGVGFMLNCDVVIESSCNHCNDKIKIVIEDNEIVFLSPEELVVWGDMEYSDCAATSVCKNINFFSSVHHFNEWQKSLSKRRGIILDLQEAFYLGKLFFEKRLRSEL